MHALNSISWYLKGKMHPLFFWGPCKFVSSHFWPKVHENKAIKKINEHTENCTVTIFNQIKRWYEFRMLVSTHYAKVKSAFQGKSRIYRNIMFDSCIFCVKYKTTCAKPVFSWELSYRLLCISTSFWVLRAPESWSN